MIVTVPVLPIDGTGAPIPQRLHQVWVGSPPPPWVQAAWARWDEFMAKHHPYWDVLRWTDETVADARPLRHARERLEGQGVSPRGISDFLRLQALSYLGGVYADSDTLPLRPLDPWAGRRKSWVCGDDVTERQVHNCMMGFRPGHAFLAEAWHHAFAQLNRGVRSDFALAGPHTFRKVFDAMAEPPDLAPGMTVVQDRGLGRVMAEGTKVDDDALRERFPDTAILHVTFYLADYVVKGASDARS